MPAVGWLTEMALYAAMKNGHVASAALDVFETEPARESRFLSLIRWSQPLIWAPLQQRSTEKVALRVAEQMADYLNSNYCLKYLEYGVCYCGKSAGA